MRTVLLSFLVAACASCAAPSAVEKSPEVRFHNGSRLECTLLAMTDTMLVIDVLCQSWNNSATRSTMGLMAIPVSGVRQVYLPGRRMDWKYAHYGAAIGGGLGALLGATGDTKKPERKPGDLFAPIDIGRVGATVLSALALGAVGYCIGTIEGVLLLTPERTLDPADSKALSRLRDAIGVVSIPRGIDRSWTYTPRR